MLSAGKDSSPWLVPAGLENALLIMITRLDSEYTVHGNVAVHSTAIVESSAVLKGPLVIGPRCFIGANAYLRGGVFLDSSVIIGPGSEVKSSIIMSESHLAHFNFVGDSIIGHKVNFEAGAVICNHWNERKDKQIRFIYKGQAISTGVEKFGAIVADGCKIGANAVLSPGTVLDKNSVIKRLALIEQTI